MRSITFKASFNFLNLIFPTLNTKFIRQGPRKWENRKYYAFDPNTLKADVSLMWKLSGTGLNSSLNISSFQTEILYKNCHICLELLERKS